MIRFICVVIFILLFGVFTLPMYFYVDHVGKTDMHKKARISQKLVRGGFKFIMWFCRVKVDVEGVENVPTDQPVLYASNHRGAFDILVGYTTVPTLTGFVAKKEIAKIPVISNWMKRLNCLFLDRENPREDAALFPRPISILPRRRRWRHSADGILYLFFLQNIGRYVFRPSREG